MRVQDELKRALTVSVKGAGGGSATGRELELQNENDKLMVRSRVLGWLVLAINGILQALLRCSTCKLSLKSHVLLKCMHSM